MTNSVLIDIDTIDDPRNPVGRLVHAATVIDQVFGDGYAKAHPELVAAQIQTGELAAIADHLGNIAEQLGASNVERCGLETDRRRIEEKDEGVSAAIVDLNKWQSREPETDDPNGK